MLKQDIINSIFEFAKKKVEQHENYHNSLELEYQRNRRRITNPPPKEVKIPVHWKTDRKHNPYYVLGSTGTVLVLLLRSTHLYKQSNSLNQNSIKMVPVTPKTMSNKEHDRPIYLEMI